ncbi:hypothetical protein B0H66DRAFT_642511 [Apodospora peruviana]|uniref:Trafficking protein particle complex subunit 13 n=1 Tax=Apodospora peruviana TaxID=516989 RepID=A0AAE0M182_9PEZI|nr:hypothetical protein B0H66DRAFT_642511 [Apodospora peruviana]
MSHQRYPSHSDAVKEPHSVSLKVLRLSRPSLVTQYPVQPPSFLSAGGADIASRHPPPIPASLAYSPAVRTKLNSSDPEKERTTENTNPDAFILSPIVNLPPSFGSAYVGETFSCTLCVNHDVLLPGEGGPGPGQQKKTIRDVRIEAEMKTPATTTTTTTTTTGNTSTPSSGGGVTKLPLSPPSTTPGTEKGGGGVDLAPGETLQKIVNFDLKDEGNHVLAITVSYYEATDVSGRTRTFRKLYQFICKGSLIVRTKPGPLTTVGGRRRWVLEAQLENCSEDAMQLEKVVMDLEPGLVYSDCNWELRPKEGSGDGEMQKPVLHPGEVEQACFVIEEDGDGECGKGGDGVREQDGRIVFGVLGVGWRSEMGNRGFLSTGKLSTRFVKPRE